MSADDPLAIAHTESSLGWGGQEIRTLTEAAGFIGRGHRVTLYAARGSRIAAEAPRFGVPVATLPIGRKRPAGVRSLVAALRRHPVDVVNAHSSTDAWLAALACAWLARAGRAPVLVRTRHVSIPVPRDYATRWLYRTATARVVTTGAALREQLIRDNGLDPSRVDAGRHRIDARSVEAVVPDQLLAQCRAGGHDALGRGSIKPACGVVARDRDGNVPRPHEYGRRAAGSCEPRARECGEPRVRRAVRVDDIDRMPAQRRNETAHACRTLAADRQYRDRHAEARCLGGDS